MAKRGESTTSSSPPWLDSTTLGAPATACFAPVLTSTSHRPPGFSVTMAWFVPGRKASAQGALKVATGEIANCGSSVCAALDEGAAPHAASRHSERACIKRRVIVAIPYMAVMAHGVIARCGPLYKTADATLQPSLARDRGPPHVIEQSDAKARAREAFGGRKALFDRLSGVFDNAGIARRHIVAPQDWYMEIHGWHDRNNLYLEASEALFAEAACAAIEKAGLTPDQIDGMVTVSTTGIATPSLEARVGPRIGLRADARRVPVFGLGCAGGVNGLALAARLASSEPGSNGCSSPSRPARSRSALIAATRRQSSRLPCSATAPRRRW